MNNQDSIQDDEIEIEEEIEVSVYDNIAELARELEAYEEAPDEAILEAWKSTYGKFFVSSILGDDTIFIWRTICSCSKMLLVAKDNWRRIGVVRCWCSSNIIKTNII